MIDDIHNIVYYYTESTVKRYRNRPVGRRPLGRCGRPAAEAKDAAVRAEWLAVSRRLKGVPGWEQAVKIVEELRGEKWTEFRDRCGDWGRDLALYLGRRRCGLKLKVPGELVGRIDYGSVSVPS